MQERNYKRLPPWTMQKRIRVAFLATLAIAVIAFLLGSIIYFSGSFLGLFQSQSLMRLVKNSLLEDPSFMNAAKRELIQHQCSNRVYQFSVFYSSELYPTNEQGEEACLLFVKSYKDKRHVLQISRVRESKSEVIQEQLTSLQDVLTDSFSHPVYDGSLVTGNKNGKKYRSVILDTGVYRYLFSYVNDVGLDDSSFISLIRSFHTL